MDWAEACRILGVPETATDAEIKEQYFYKVQLLHPDKNQDKPESVRNRAESELAMVNQAYHFLINPKNNPYKVPPKLAVEPMGIRFVDVAIGEKKVTTLTVRNIGGPYTSIWIDNQPATWLVVTGVKSTTGERLPLQVTLECIGSGEPGKWYSSDLLIELKNENTRAIDRAAVRIEMYTRSAPPVSGTRKPAPVSAKNTGFARNGPAPQPPQNKKLGFSPFTFVLNFLALAILGALAVYLLNYFLILNELIILTISIVLVAIDFGVSFNHAITVGSRTEKPKNKIH